MPGQAQPHDLEATRGQVLATFAPEMMQADVATNRAVIAEAEAALAEATANARKSAEQFAKDSGARLAGIRSANQGVVSISDRDRGSPQVKTVRVVTTVEYFLKD